MVGLVIATHGRLAEELVATAEQIVGKLEGVVTCEVQPGRSPKEIQDDVRAAIASVDSGEGVLVLADLFGGTPCNCSLALSADHALEVVTGVNLPMILKASSLRQQALSLPQMAQTLVEYCQRNITCASSLLRDAVAGSRGAHSR